MRRWRKPETDDALSGSATRCGVAKNVCVLGAGPPSLSPDPPPVSGRRNGGLAGDGARPPTGLPRGREGVSICPSGSCRVSIAKLCSYHQLLRLSTLVVVASTPGLGCDRSLSRNADFSIHAASRWHASSRYRLRSEAGGGPGPVKVKLYARADTIRPDARMYAGLSPKTNGVPRDLGVRRGWGGD